MSKLERERLESEWRRKFTLTNGDEWIAAFDPEMGSTLASVVEDLVANFQGPDGPVPPDEDDGSSYNGMDMAVWKGDRLVAVVRKGPDGKPQATVF